VVHKNILTGLLMAVLAVPAMAQGNDAASWENSLGMHFVKVPAGSFQMGNARSPERMKELFPQYAAARMAELADEMPTHTVWVTRDFWLGEHEVTVGQFRQFIQQSGHVPESVRDGTGGYGYDPEYDPAKTERHDAFAGRDPKYSWANPGFAQGDDHPVLNVTWNDAVAMATWLSEKEGRRYRLPTEAEWEYACNAGQSTLFPIGNDPVALDLTANVFDASSAKLWPQWAAYARPADDGFPFTAPVGSFEPNAFGLYDMAGNAWEWTADWYDENYYQDPPLEDPQGPAQGSVKVRRGGSWHTWPLYARCNFRNVNSPDTRYVLQGMRLLLEKP
jgi:formylglycine-generating enzyme required for sulfatase activity